MHRTSDGCRPDQLFGLWAIEETRFATLVEMAKSADLATLHAASVGADAPSQTLCAIDGRIALIGINGPMTKYPTSLSSMFGGISTIRTRQALRAAARSPEVDGIMVTSDTPGGTVAGAAAPKAPAEEPAAANAQPDRTGPAGRYRP